MSLLGSSRKIAAEFLEEQLQMDGIGTGKLSEIFDEEPPPLDVFLYDKKYLNHMRPTVPIPDESGYAFKLSPIQFDFVRNFEQIFYPELYISMVEEFGTYWTPLPMKHMFALEWGKGSGKDMSVRIGFTRITNLLSCMRSPQTYYSMAATDSIQMLNVAATAQQARDAFFDPMKRLFISNKYLSSLFKGDDPAEGSHRLKLNKNITIISGNSMAENQEGLNLIAGVADEISAFKVAEEFRDKGDGRAARGAEQIVSMLRSSASSRFPHSYKIAQISWPRFSGDAIEKALAAGKASQKELGEASTWYVSGPHATWEVKPGVTKENFIEHYRENAEMAAAMYECRPPKATNAFIRDEQSIDAAFEEIKDDPIQVDYYWGYPPESAGAGDPSQLQEGWQVKFTFSPDLVPIPGALYCMHGDMAIKGDRAGIAMSHVQKYLAANGEEERPVIKNDFVFTFESDISTNPPREVQIRWYRQLIWELIERGFIIATVTFDQFQCLSGDTRIPLLDGTTKTMRELDGAEDFWVYSINAEGSIVPGRVTKARWTGFRSDMLEITLDNGESIKATRDHRFMLRDGTYREAGELQAGDSLMPLYRRQRKVSPSSAEYEQVWHPEAAKGRNRWQHTHSMVSHWAYGKLPKGWVTHHIDCSKSNNSPDNLRQMSSEDHTALHQSIGRKGFSEAWADPAWRAAHIERISRAQSARQTGLRGEETNRYNQNYTMELIEATHESLLANGRRPTKKAMREEIGIAQATLYDRVREAGYSSWKDFRDQHETISPSALKQRAHRVRKMDPNNHKVVSVQPAPPEDVYDLEVQDFHNFATEAGVFVHNSFDMMQTLQMHGIDSGLLSLDRTDKVYQSLKDVILDGRLKGYRPIEHTDPLVVSEIKRLRRIGKKVDHPPSFSKDAADALAGSVFNAIEVGGQEEDIVLDERFLSEDPMAGWIMAQANQSHSGNTFGLFGGSGPSDIMNRGYFHR